MSGLSVALICFVVIVMPIWITAHYAGKKHQLSSLAEEDVKVLEELLVSLDRLEQRLTNLEKLVDPAVTSSSREQFERGAA